jgi:hypothetical protein
MSSQEIQSAKMRLLGDLRAAVRYTPDQQADLVAFMQQYIKEEPEQRPEILKHIRSCMDGEPYPDPYAGQFPYTEADVDRCERILDDCTAAMEVCDGSSQEIRQLVDAVTAEINQLNEACNRGLIDTWRREQLCNFINGTAEMAGAKPGEDMTLGQRMW